MNKLKVESVTFEETHQEFTIDNGDTLYMQLPNCPDSQSSVDDEAHEDFNDEMYLDDYQVESAIDMCEQYIIDNCKDSLAISCVANSLEAKEIEKENGIIKIKVNDDFIFACALACNDYYNVYMLNKCEENGRFIF